jgi:hypothetical protein
MTVASQSTLSRLLISDIFTAISITGSQNDSASCQSRQVDNGYAANNHGGGNEPQG